MQASVPPFLSFSIINRTVRHNIRQIFALKIFQKTQTLQRVQVHLDSFICISTIIRKLFFGCRLEFGLCFNIHELLIAALNLSPHQSSSI